MAEARCVTRWVPSHLSWPAAEARGILWDDWAGNQMADYLARAAAKEAAPPAALIRARTTDLQALAAVQSCLIAMQQLQMESSEKRGLRRCRKRPRLRKPAALRVAPARRRKRPAPRRS